MAAHATPRSRSGLATAVAILLIGVAFAVAWWAIAPTVLGDEAPAIPGLEGAYAETVVADAAPAAALLGHTFDRAPKVKPPKLDRPRDIARRPRSPLCTEIPQPLWLRFSQAA